MHAAESAGDWDVKSHDGFPVLSPSPVFGTMCRSHSPAFRNPLSSRDTLARNTNAPPVSRRGIRVIKSGNDLLSRTLTQAVHRR